MAVLTSGGVASPEVQGLCRRTQQRSGQLSGRQKVYTRLRLGRHQRVYILFCFAVMHSLCQLQHLGSTPPSATMIDWPTRSDASAVFNLPLGPSPGFCVRSLYSWDQACPRPA